MFPLPEIPIYLLAGRYDYTRGYSLQKAYYRQIQAPLKGFYTFANAAHSALFEEPKKTRAILSEDVLNGTNISSDHIA